MTDRNGGWLRETLQAAANEALTTKGLTLNVLAKELHMPLAVLEGILRGTRHGTMTQWSTILIHLGIEEEFGPNKPKTPKFEASGCTCPYSVSPRATGAVDCPLHGLEAQPEEWAKMIGGTYRCDAVSGDCQCNRSFGHVGRRHRCDHGIWEGTWRTFHHPVSSPFEALSSELANLRRQFEREGERTDRRMAKLEAMVKIQKDHVHNSYSGPPRAS